MRKQKSPAYTAGLFWIFQEQLAIFKKQKPRQRRDF